MINFYRMFIPHCEDILRPLNAFLLGSPAKTKKLCWSGEADAAFSQAKSSPCSATLLNFPSHNAHTILSVDASDLACGAVLQQSLEGK